MSIPKDVLSFTIAVVIVLIAVIGSKMYGNKTKKQDKASFTEAYVNIAFVFFGSMSAVVIFYVLIKSIL